MTREPIDVMNLLSGKKQPILTSEIPISKIDRPEWQPRNNFSDDKMLQLQQSIKNHGLLQPIIVEPYGDRYKVVAGERRFRALQNLGWQNVPVKIVDNIDNTKRIQIQIAENLNREDITPLERANAVLKLFEVTLGWDLDKTINNLRNYHQKHLTPELTPTVGVILEQLGKSENTIISWLKLLKLPQEIRKMLDDEDGVFTPKHAGEIQKISDIELQLKIARIIESENLSSEQTKELIDTLSTKQTKKIIENRSKTLNLVFSTYAKKLINSIKLENIEEMSQEVKAQYVSEIESLLKELTIAIKSFTGGNC